jgi:heat shock protein HtpX
LRRAVPIVFSERRRRRHKLRNLVQSLLLLGGMLIILAVCAASIWGAEGVAWAVIGGMLGLMLTPTVAPEWVMRMYRAALLRPRDLPEIFPLLQELAARAGLKALPQLYYIRSPLLNAFAVGRPDAAAIGLTDGILRALTTRELAGVLAHELSHIRNNDLWTMNLADILTRLTSLMSWLGQLLLLLNLPILLMNEVPIPWILVLVLIFAPTLVSLLQLALSRSREFDADIDAAALTGDPRGLASALAKLEHHQGRYWEEIFLPGRRMPEPSVLRTHPPTEERIRRLLELYETAERLPFPVHAVPGHVLHPPPWAAAMPHGPRWRWPGVWY